MVLVLIEVEMDPVHRLEFRQTLYSLVPGLMAEEGCLSCRLFSDIQDRQHLLVLMECENRRDLNELHKGRHFRILMGAINNLGKGRSPRVRISDNRNENDTDEVV